MQRWQLPEYIADILPSTARRIENFKEKLLALFKVHGYQLVCPPLMEYTESLLTRIDPGLGLKTIRVVDQISGKQLGLRADITPQIARIDAHLLSHNEGVHRLCYAGSVLHAQPDGLFSTREPLQIGAEIYGYKELQADIESIDLMIKSIQLLLDEQPLVLSLGHIDIFRVLAKEANLSDDDRHALLALMQSKDVDEINAWCRFQKIDSQLINYLLILPRLYGSEKILSTAQEKLPKHPQIEKSLNQLKQIVDNFKDYPIHLDLAELRMDHYHSGLLFGVYRQGNSDALARGGRYDGLGNYFGRARAATGFSFDLKTFLPTLPEKENEKAILVKKDDALNAKDFIDCLRKNGEIVLIDYLAEGTKKLHCNRQIVHHAGEWVVHEVFDD